MVLISEQSEILTEAAAKFLESSSRRGEGNGNPLQYSCLENPMDGGAWDIVWQGLIFLFVEIDFAGADGNGPCKCLRAHRPLSIGKTP